MKKIIYTLLFLLVFICILSYSRESMGYALWGLQLWFENMIPALFPFMILSGILVRMELAGSFAGFFSPVINPLFRLSPHANYCMILGFFCGFPMGAKTVAEMYRRKQISFREGEFLLAFCNNIGPVYFCSFVLPLLNRKLVLPYLIGMYGIPLVYGLILRYTIYRDIGRQTQTKDFHSSTASKTDLLSALENSVSTSIESIVTLGGYMIFFSIWNLFPYIISGKTNGYLAPVWEITGGLRLASETISPLYALLLLPFGGLSCIAQTNSCIQGTGLSLIKYMIHKLILTLLTAAYYLGWFLLFPASFLR